MNNKYALRIVSSPSFGRRLAREYTPKNKQLKHSLESGDREQHDVDSDRDDDDDDTFIAVVKELLRDSQKKRCTAISGEASVVELERSLNILHNSIAMCVEGSDESKS